MNDRAVPSRIQVAMAALIGGALGSAARAWFEWIAAALGQPPWTSRIAVNLLGAFAIGCWFGRSARRRGAVTGTVDGTSARILREDLLVAGCLGGFTTVSGFAWDVASAVGGGDPARAALLVGIDGIIGLCACLAGFSIMQRTRAGSGRRP